MTAMCILVLWCVLPVVIGTLRTLILRSPDPGATLILNRVSSGPPITGSARGRREG